MGNIALFKNRSVNLTALGVMYALASLLQAIFWVKSFGMDRPEYLPGMVQFALSSPTIIGHVTAAVFVIYHILFVTVIAFSFYIGCKLVWISQKQDVVIRQSQSNQIEMLKAIAFLAVVFFLVMVLVPSVHAKDAFGQIFMIELMAFLMAGYNFFAVMKYYRQ
jgi:hypothetical protein